MISFKQYLRESLDNPYRIKYSSNVTWNSGERGVTGDFKTDNNIKYNIRGYLTGRTKKQLAEFEKQKKDNKKKQTISLPPIGIRKGGIWEIHFDKIKGSVDNPDDYNNTITGDGDALRIFATILEFGKHLIKTQDPDIINIKSKTGAGGGSRTRLYNTIIKKYASKYGYKVKNIIIDKDITNVEMVKV